MNLDVPLTVRITIAGNEKHVQIIQLDLCPALSGWVGRTSRRQFGT